MSFRLAMSDCTNVVVSGNNTRSNFKRERFLPPKKKKKIIYIYIYIFKLERLQNVG